jgi:WD40 repeat protein
VAHGEAGKDGAVQLYRIAKDGRADITPLVTITSHADAIYALAFSPDGTRLATGGYDRVIHIWNIPPGLPADSVFLDKPKLTLKDHSDAIYALAWHLDGNLLASGSADRSVKLWDTATGKRLHTLGDATDWVYCLAWSPDRKHLAAGSVDKTLRVWEANADGAKLILSAFAHEKPIWRLAYTADGKLLYTVGEDRVIKRWDAARITETKTYDPQPDAILDFAVRPDGKQLAIARFDGVLALVDPATDKPTAQPLPPPPRKAVAPRIARLEPDAGLRGTTTRVVVTGSDLDLVNKLTTSSGAVRVAITNASPRPPRRPSAMCS